MDWEYFQTLSFMGAENQDVKIALLTRLHRKGLKDKIKKEMAQFQGGRNQEVTNRTQQKISELAAA